MEKVINITKVDNEIEFYINGYYLSSVQASDISPEAEKELNKPTTDTIDLNLILKMKNILTVLTIDKYMRKLFNPKTLEILEGHLNFLDNLKDQLEITDYAIYKLHKGQ